MVSIESAQLFLFPLLSSALLIPRSPDDSSESLARAISLSVPTTSSGSTAAFTTFSTSSAATTPGPRPWVMNKFSQAFVDNAVSIRASGVPPEKASSVAKVIIDAALRPTQYTQLAEEADQMWFMNGDEPDATSLYKFATNARDAYQQVHNKLPYWSLVDYVRTEGTNFNTSLISHPSTTAAWATDPAIESQVNSVKSHCAYVYYSLKANPTGSAALDTLKSVASDYIHDFTFYNKMNQPAESSGQIKPGQSSGQAKPAESSGQAKPAESSGQAKPAESSGRAGSNILNSGVVENLLMSLMGTV